MKTLLFMSVAMFICNVAVARQSLRAPSIPLVACDPYFSIWSSSDKLADSETNHWTGRTQSLRSTITIDGKALRLMGTEPVKTPTMEQKEVLVLPTRTVYRFQSSEIDLTLTFLTPSLPESIELLSWPVTYISYAVQSRDGKKHQVTVDFEASMDIAIDEPNQKTTWSQPTIQGLSTMNVGSQSQQVLGRCGDELRIDWGYLYVSAPESQKPKWNDHRMELDFGVVSDQESLRWLMLAYDDLYSIQYMQRNLRPY